MTFEDAIPYPFSFRNTLSLSFLSDLQSVMRFSHFRTVPVLLQRLVTGSLHLNRCEVVSSLAFGFKLF
ncbi:hypothetical protein Y032_0137g2014 [Ancylostoma ceylanicum]|uniref:Uncharacterized protein n=1 Tax=Ancylostoma ceylanicum TaxID=53326 RepID=A0A016T597_9BILA|nr:hypothetical protein Y032_0137g2014 [Ancylostoma ceylanicum]